MCWSGWVRRGDVRAIIQLRMRRGTPGHDGTNELFTATLTLAAIGRAEHAISRKPDTNGDIGGQGRIYKAAAGIGAVIERRRIPKQGR